MESNYAKITTHYDYDEEDLNCYYPIGLLVKSLAYLITSKIRPDNESKDRLVFKYLIGLRYE